MKKKTILVVDDDLDLLEQMTTMLKSSGYEVVSADNRAAAEDAILKTKPDLAILDLMMEEKDSGFVLSYQIKKLYPETPVIMLTAVVGSTGVSFATQDSQAKSWTMVDTILDKPVRPEQIKAEIRRFLKEEPEDAAGNHH